jgi:hypothetical protein
MITWSRLRSTIVVSVLCLVALAGCSSGKPTGSTTTTVAKKASGSGAVPGNLRPTIFDRLPARYIEEPAGTGSDGPLGLAATANAVDDQDPALEQTLLAQYGFRSAYQRTWVVKGTGEVLIIRVQVMGSPKESLGYYNLMTFYSRTNTQLIAFPTSQLADASGFSRTFAASTGKQQSQDINMVRGVLFFHFIFTGPLGSVTPADVVKIAESQSGQAASLGYP